MTENVLPFRNRQETEAQDHEEYLEANRRQAIDSLKFLLKEMEEGRSCGFLGIMFSNPDRDGAGYKMVFNDAVIDYTMQTIGAIEMVKQRIVTIRDAEYGDCEIEPVPEPDS